MAPQVIPPYQAAAELDTDVDVAVRPKRTRRSKLDTRTPADFVPEEKRVKVAALYWLMRQERQLDYRLLELFDGTEVVRGIAARLPLRASMIYTSWKAARPAPNEVAACCWSVATSAKNPYSFYSHVNSAAHLAQHFRVDVRDVIHEARALKVVLALASDEDKT